MADTEELLSKLTLEEKASLTAGDDMMSMVPVERLGIPKIRVTDGPNGARGPSYPGLGGPSSTCIPCGSAIGATWDPELAERLGQLVGREALDRGCRGLLAPTVNLHRSPLAGRNFECYSEDPLLSGRLAAGYIRGVQSNGVFATVKHFVANDAEFERGSISSVVEERALRELYLVPFELAVREGGVLGLMTAYNRVNGAWVTEQRALLTDLLRDEWGFEGIVMTDWFGIVDTRGSLGAGLDLEMPGPGRSLGSKVREAVEAGAGSLASDLDNAVMRLLNGLNRIGALDAPTPPIDPKPPTDHDLALIRRAAAEATVLLTNDGILPIDSSGLRQVAVIGPNASLPRIQGGGSAQVMKRRQPTMIDPLASALGDVAVVVERGCEVDRSATVIGRGVLRATSGFSYELFDGSELAGEPMKRGELDELRLFVMNTSAQGYPSTDWSMRIRGLVVSDEDGTFEIALAQSGRARLSIDDDPVLDGFVDPPPPGGRDFFGGASQDITHEVGFTAGVAKEFVVEYARGNPTIAGVRIGYRTKNTDVLIDRAVAAAAASDLAVLFVGTTEEWESEGHDRSSLHLPGRQDELIERVAAANPKTVVVLNTGAPVAMPWADDVGGIVQCWFGGDEMADAVAQVLTGSTEPGGRLPTTIPMRLEHNPSYDHFPGENGELLYGEGLFMGYRGYEHRAIEPRFAFGHGLSYTTFEIGAPRLSSPTFRSGDVLTVSVEVRNTGTRPGSEVVQCYVAPVSPRLARPPKELKAFSKVWLDPGKSTVVDLQLDDRSFAYWDPGQHDWDKVAERVGTVTAHFLAESRRSAGWQLDSGRFEVVVGRSSAVTGPSVSVEVIVEADRVRAEQGGTP